MKLFKISYDTGSSDYVVAICIIHLMTNLLKKEDVKHIREIVWQKDLDFVHTDDITIMPADKED